MIDRVETYAGGTWVQHYSDGHAMVCLRGTIWQAAFDAGWDEVIEGDKAGTRIRRVLARHKAKGPYVAEKIRDVYFKAWSAAFDYRYKERVLALAKQNVERACAQ